MTEYTLAPGTHARPQDGRCAMEWVSHLAGEPHSDQPRCVSPVLRALCIALNDGLGDEPRQRLRPYLTRTIGTADDGRDEWRAWLALDWLIRTHTPAWLELAGLRAQAGAVAGLEPVTDSATLLSARRVLQRARTDARDARGPGAPWDAVRTTARETAWSCAGGAAWAAARLAVGDIAGDRARALAQNTAGDAAAAHAQAMLGARRGGRSAQREATRALLEPTRRGLQRSLLNLLDQMLPLAPVTLPAPAPGTPPAIFTTSV